MQLSNFTWFHSRLIYLQMETSPSSKTHSYLLFSDARKYKHARLFGLLLYASTVCLSIYHGVETVYRMKVWHTYVYD